MLIITSSIGSLDVLIPQARPEVITIKTALPRTQTETQNTVIKNKVMTVEEYVRNYFSDIPILVEIARCESRFRQHDKNGEVLRGEKNSFDRGVMQINEYFHNEDSAKLGYDILTLEGNTAYSRYLFDRYGVQPWISSQGCWGRTAAYIEYQNLALAKNN